MCKRVLVAAIVLCAVGVGVAQGAINYDPSQTAPAPVLNNGWAYDQINAALPALSIDSPYPYNLGPGGATFAITDDFIVGDVYTVFDFGVPILVTAFGPPPSHPFGFGPPNPFGDLAWQIPQYSHGEVFLGPGAHLLTVGGNGAGGVPAGLWVRIDGGVIPEPASLLIWSLLGCVAIGGWLWRRRKTA